MSLGGEKGFSKSASSFLGKKFIIVSILRKGKFFPEGNRRCCFFELKSNWYGRVALALIVAFRGILILPIFSEIVEWGFLVDIFLGILHSVTLVTHHCWCLNNSKTVLLSGCPSYSCNCLCNYLTPHTDSDRVSSTLFGSFNQIVPVPKTFKVDSNKINLSVYETTNMWQKMNWMNYQNDLVVKRQFRYGLHATSPTQLFLTTSSTTHF